MIVSGFGPVSKDFYAEVAKGLIPGQALIHKFGHGIATTTLSPIGTAMTYKTPTAATALEFVSSDANDTAAGTGAQQITIIGLDANWAEVSQTIETNGTTAVALSTNLIRLYRWYVSRSGAYASTAGGSHVGTLTIREAGAGATWTQIGLYGAFGLGQSEIACYTVPLGKTAYLLSKKYSIQNGKVVDIFFFQRPLANDVTTPFTGTMRIVEREVDVAGDILLKTISPKGPFVGPCDLGVMAKISAGTGEVSVDFELLLVNS